MKRLRSTSPPFLLKGKIVEAQGNTILARLPSPKLGSQVKICTSNGEKRGIITSLKKPYASLSVLGSIEEVSLNDSIYQVEEECLQDTCTFQIGSTHNFLGQVLIHGNSNSILKSNCFPFHPRASGFKNKLSLNEKITTHIAPIDYCVPIAKGQRILIIAPPGCGKSSLLTHYISSSQSDLNILLLVGERGREISDMHARIQHEKLSHSTIIICASSGDSPFEQLQAVETAVQIAEEYAEQGKDVCITLDSLTRYLRAQRNVSLANGESASRAAYPVSVYTSLAKLIERFGKFDKGSITGIFTMLDPEESFRDEMIEEAISLCDGHIHLDSSLAEKGVYPAIDLSRSLSRVQGDLLNKEEKEIALRLRKISAQVKSDQDLILLSQNSERQSTYEMYSNILDKFLQARTNSKELVEILDSLNTL